MNIIKSSIERRKPALATGLLAAILAVISLQQTATCGNLTINSSEFANSIPTYTPPTFTPPVIQPPTFTPPPVVTTPPPLTRVPVIPQVPRLPNVLVNPILPTDVTGRQMINVGPGESVSALAGIKTVEGFPADDRVGSHNDFVRAEGEPGSEFHKLNSYTVDVQFGRVLVSVRKPTRLAFITSPLAKVSITGDADLLVTEDADTIRIINMTGRNESVKVKLNHSAAAAAGGKVIALAPGYEIIASKNVLKRSLIRVADGLARRNFKLLEDGSCAVCEISVESVLAGSSLVANFSRDREDLQKRVVSDISKMAAVLNYVHGSEGFVREDLHATVASH